MAKRLSLAEIISEVTGEVWDISDDESCLPRNVIFRRWSTAVESLEAATIRPPHASTLADGDGRGGHR